MWYNNPYLKENIIGFTPLNKFSYQSINLGFTFIFSFLNSLGIKSWWFSSNRRYLDFSVSFLFWISHWGLYSLWRNIIPWSRVAYDSINIFSLIVSHNIIHCCAITVCKTDHWLQGISTGPMPRKCNKLNTYYYLPNLRALPRMIWR